MTEPHAGRRRPNHMTWRHWLLASIVALALVALLGRLAWIQIANHERYAELAAASRADTELLPAPRGAILDASGHPLAISIDTWDLYIDSLLWRDRERAGEAAAALGSAMGLDPEALFELGISQSNGDLIVQRFIDYERGLALRERGIWGVRLLPSSQRVYAEQDLAGPLIGYVGLDGSGLWGIERDFDPVLRGRPGLLLSERDPLGRPIAFAASGGRAPTVGGEVQLTIDRFIQAIAEQRLAEAVEANKASGGTVIVMEPRNRRDPRDGLAAHDLAVGGRPRRRGRARSGPQPSRLGRLRAGIGVQDADHRHGDRPRADHAADDLRRPWLGACRRPHHPQLGLHQLRRGHDDRVSAALAQYGFYLDLRADRRGALLRVPGALRHRAADAHRGSRARRRG